MNILLLGHEDIASLYALDSLIQRLPQHVYSVLWSGTVAPPKHACPTLEALAAADRILFDDYLARRATAAEFSAAGTLAAPNSPEGLRMIASTAPDLIVSIRYRRILREDAIAIPHHGVLNLHSGILPDYRGVMASFWAMLAGEKEMGTTLHRIVDGSIDTGPVIDSHCQAVDYSASYLDNLMSLYPSGCEMIEAAINTLDAGGEVTAEQQLSGDGNYYGPPSEADARRFLEKGHRLY